MSKHIRMLLATVIALVAIGAAAATATAAELSVEPGGEATATSLGSVTFSSSLTRVECRLILLLSLHHVITKVATTLMGYVTRVTASECNPRETAVILETGGTAANPANVAWHILYVGIRGTLPNNVQLIIVKLKQSQFLLRIPSIFGTQTCLFEGPVEGNIGVTGRNPYTSGLLTILANRVPLKTAALNTGLCPREGELIGTFGLSPVQTITRI